VLVKSEKTEAEQLEGKCRWHHKKKTMKTNKKHSTKNNKASTSGGNPNFGSELQSRSEQLSGNENRQTATAATPETAPEKTGPDSQPSTLNPQPPKRILPYVNFQQRDANRALATDEVLDMLRRWVPQAYDLAEVVGKWVWITFPEAPSEQLRGQLSQLGFHWNNVRKCWQHPCGQFTTTGTSQDPREKYGSHFAGDLKAA